MIAPMAFALLVAAMLSVSIGAGRLVGWLLDRRESKRTRPIRDAAFAAQACAEMAGRDYAIAMLDQESMGEACS